LKVIKHKTTVTAARKDEAQERIVSERKTGLIREDGYAPGMTLRKKKREKKRSSEQIYNSGGMKTKNERRVQVINVVATRGKADGGFIRKR